MSRKKRHIAAFGICALLVAGVVGWQITGDGGRKEMKVENYHNGLFGENVYIFSPEDDPAEVSRILEDIYDRQEENQFGEERYAVYFLPGVYEESIDVNVGFYTQVAGLGELPTDTRIPALKCTAEWLGDDPNNHNACCNFWRGVENIEIGSNTMWAVSQATFMRRAQIDGALFLHDSYGWCSGGFLADSNIELLTDSGSQQQWLSRNCNWKTWMGANWNMVFLGIEEGKSPKGTWPAIAYTDAGATERIQEKPFLIYDEKEGYQVFVPTERMEASGTSWKEEVRGERIPISDFYVAKPGTDTAATLNAALSKGKHLFLTPGIYDLEEPLVVTEPDTIVLGTGLATLRPTRGNACIETADVPGIILAGLLFDAGREESESLLVVGCDTVPASADRAAVQGGAGDIPDTAADWDGSAKPAGDYITLSDLFFRVGGASTGYAAKVKNCVVINSSHVTGDNFWVWRADHGDEVAWDKNTAPNGILINGDDVNIYALMVEHFEEYQTIWNGDDGKVVMYQSEIPYDVPTQEEWMSHEGTMDGYASFYVAEDVEQFEAWGLGIYLYNRDAAVNLNTAMEVPDKEGVKVHNICTVMITGNPGMSHVINDTGGAVQTAGAREMICEYEAGILK